MERHTYQSPTSGNGMASHPPTANRVPGPRWVLSKCDSAPDPAGLQTVDRGHVWRQQRDRKTIRKCYFFLHTNTYTHTHTHTQTFESTQESNWCVGAQYLWWSPVHWALWCWANWSPAACSWKRPDPRSALTACWSGRTLLIQCWPSNTLLLGMRIFFLYIIINTILVFFVPKIILFIIIIVYS